MQNNCRVKKSWDPVEIVFQLLNYFQLFNY